MRSQAPTGVFATLKATPTPVRYLLGGVLVNQLGAFVQTFILLYLMYRGVSVGRAGLCLVAYSVGSILGTLLGGELTHRVGPRLTITMAMGASAPLVASIPWLSGPAWYGVLLVVVALAGLVTQAYRPAAAVLLSDLMPAQYQVMAFSMMRIALNIGAAVGPFIAAALILVDWDLLFWFDGATALLYALLAFALLPRTAHVEEEKAEAAPAMSARSAYGVMLRDTRFLSYLAAVLIGTIVYVQFFVALPIKIIDDGHPTALYSAVLATSSVVLIVAELKITTYVTRWRPPMAGSVGHFVFAIGFFGYGLAGRSSGLLIVSTLFFVSGLMISGPSMFAHPAKAPAAVKARYVGTMHAVVGLASALGPALGVFAWSRLGNGIWPVFGVCGVLAGLFAFAGMTDKTVSRPPARPAEAPEETASSETVGGRA